MAEDEFPEFTELLRLHTGRVEFLPTEKPGPEPRHELEATPKPERVGAFPPTLFTSEERKAMTKSRTMRRLIGWLIMIPAFAMSAIAAFTSSIVDSHGHPIYSDLPMYVWWAIFGLGCLIHGRFDGFD